MSDADVLIIGGGISGLSTAWWLARQGIGVELWESDSRTGGKIQSRREQGYLTEQAAGILMNFRPEVDRMIEACGLVDQKQSRGKNLKRHVLDQGRLAEVPMTIPGILRSPLWSPKAKLRMASEILVPRGNKPDETVSEFIKRRLGPEILHKAIDPFIAGTLASDPEQANAATVLPRLTALERRYGSLTAGMLINRLLHRRRANTAEAFSFRKGMAELCDQLAATPGIHLRQRHQAIAVSPVEKGWRATATTPLGERATTARHLIFCTPAWITAQLLTPHDKALGSLLDGIEYAPLAVAHLGFRRDQITHPLDGSGFLVPGREHFCFTGNLWMSSLYSERAPEGKVLLTSYLGGARAPQQAGRDDNSLCDRLLNDLKGLLDLNGDPDYIRIDRHSHGLPLYHGAYQARLSQIGQRLAQWRGLHISANYIGGVAVRERIFQGHQTANNIAACLKAESKRFFFPAEKELSVIGG